MPGDVLVEVSNLKKYFPFGRGRVLKAVDGVTFSVRKGETLGLVGESGCGKTTVARTIVRIYKPDEGQVVFDGIDVHACSQREYRKLTRRMQIIYQNPYASLNPRMTVEDIIAEGLDIHGGCRDKAERRKKVHDLLRMVGLNPDHAGRFPHEFSGGQRQRVGIARVLAVNPEFVICDEPISALDVSVQAQIVNLLLRLQRELGLTYLFIAHDLSMVRHISDRTAVMYLGTLVEWGPTEEIYQHPAHPYTVRLLSAVPVADPDYERERKRIEIVGETPSPVNPRPGCRFARRCDLALKICEEVMPEPVEVGGDHFVVCHQCR